MAPSRPSHCPARRRRGEPLPPAPFHQLHHGWCPSHQQRAAARLRMCARGVGACLPGSQVLGVCCAGAHPPLVPAGTAEAPGMSSTQAWLGCTEDQAAQVWMGCVCRGLHPGRRGTACAPHQRGPPIGWLQELAAPVRAPACAPTPACPGRSRLCRAWSGRVQATAATMTTPRRTRRKMMRSSEAPAHQAATAQHRATPPGSPAASPPPTHTTPSLPCRSNVVAA